MTNQRALEHFQYKFQHHWKPTKKDIEAFNVLVKANKRLNERQYENNPLTFKLYILALQEQLKRFKTDLNDDVALKELNKTLSLPLQYFTQMLTNNLNLIQQDALLTDLSVKLEHPVTSQEETIKKEIEALKTCLVDEKESSKLFGDVWKHEEVEAMIYNLVNNAVNKLG